MNELLPRYYCRHPVSIFDIHSLSTDFVNGTNSWHLRIALGMIIPDQATVHLFFSNNLVADFPAYFHYLCRSNCLYLY